MKIGIIFVILILFAFIKNREKLKNYKSKKLEHHQMSLIADMLTLEDIKEVAKWYSSIKITVQEIE